MKLDGEREEGAIGGVADERRSRRGWPGGLGGDPDIAVRRRMSSKLSVAAVAVLRSNGP